MTHQIQSTDLNNAVQLLVDNAAEIGRLNLVDHDSDLWSLDGCRQRCEESRSMLYWHGFTIGFRLSRPTAARRLRQFPL